MRMAATRIALAAATATLLALMGPQAAQADDVGDDDEEEQPVQPRQERPPVREEPRPAPRVETRTETRTTPTYRSYDDDDIVTFATDRELVGRDTENIFGPDTPQTWQGPAHVVHGDGRRSSNGPHDGYWRKAPEAQTVIASFSSR